MIIVFLWAAKLILSEIVSCIKLSGLKIIMKKDSLIIGKNDQTYNINKEESEVLYCMMGWLIVWPSGEKKNLLLLRKLFLGCHCKELRTYLKSNANYLSQKEAKQRIIESLHVSMHDPLKYIRWPILWALTQGKQNKCNGVVMGGLPSLNN
ncbi:hypothetical protein KAR91_13200 [Candidatus Pacearchaeota archaeon]|nr:hypothetical protein [Candidatus Pacearchaeota archaeon]